MFKNFLKIAFRNLGRKKFHSFINLFGLTIGLAASIMIVSYIFYELSYDKHNEHYDKIYRIFTVINSPDGSTTEAPITSFGIAMHAANTLPEITNFVRLLSSGAQIELDNKLYNDIEVGWADSTFFNIFTHKFLSGNIKNVLGDKNAIVITKSTEQKLFGNESGLNAMIRINGDLFKITGIIEDVSINSHFEFDAIAPIYTQVGTLEEEEEQGNFSYVSYLLANGQENVDQLQKKVNQVFQDHYAAELEQYGVTVNQFLQPLSSIHLRSRSSYEMKPPGDINNIYIFSVLAFFIIIIAIINFINLTTANSETRAREIGLRKVMGANRPTLFKQFISESMLITLISFLFALGITELFINQFRDLMNSPILLLYKTNTIFLLGMLISVIIIGFIAGSYPALHLSKYLPIEVLKGSKSSSGKKSVLLQRSLVVFQFTIATFLLISLNLVYKQISFVKNKDLGFDKNQVLVIDNLTDKISNSFESLRSELTQLPEVIRITASHSVPGTGRNMSICYKEGDDPSNNILIHNNRIYYDYLHTYGMELISGREFDKSMGTDSTKVILNETAAKALGLDEPINKKINMSDNPFQVIGIVKDFHFNSLHQKIGPIAYILADNEINLISLKLSAKNIEQNIKKIEASLQDFDPGYTFSYKFIDETFAEMYAAEDRINKLITYASVLALIISILGLIALTMQTIQKKTHEIGIRKVMGGEVTQIVKMFVLELSRWVILATLIAIPIAYIFTSRWLENFVYQTKIGVDVFLVGCLISILIAIVTVGIISYNSAKANPVDSLKYE